MRRDLPSYQLSTEAACVLDLSVPRLRDNEKSRALAVMLTHSSDWGTKQREFVPVQTRIGPVYADVVTGTTYSMETGRCFTSDRMWVEV